MLGRPRPLLVTQTQRCGFWNSNMNLRPTCKRALRPVSLNRAGAAGQAEDFGRGRPSLETAPPMSARSKDDVAPAAASTRSSGPTRLWRPQSPFSAPRACESNSAAAFSAARDSRSSDAEFGGLGRLPRFRDAAEPHNSAAMAMYAEPDHGRLSPNDATSPAAFTPVRWLAWPARRPSGLRRAVRSRRSSLRPSLRPFPS